MYVTDIVRWGAAQIIMSFVRIEEEEGWKKEKEEEDATEDEQMKIKNVQKNGWNKREGKG